LTLLVFSGCVSQATDGSTIVFAFQWWVPLAGILITVAATVAGWFVKNVSERWGYGLLIMGPIMLVIMAPGLFLDRVTIDDEHFTLRTGFWFYPTVRDVRFSDVQRIELTSQRRRRSTDRDMHCRLRNGTVTRVPVGTLMQYAADEILDRADQKGIPIEGQL
jgi:hypothetical protein